MAFKNASAFGYSITLPFGQNSYTIQSPNVEVGHALVNTTVAAGKAYEMSQALADMAPDDPDRQALIDALEELAASLELPDAMTTEYFQSILGPAYDEMKANGEPYELLKMAAATVSVWVINGLALAEEYWNNGGRRPNPRRTPRDRRQKTKKATSK